MLGLPAVDSHEEDGDENEGYHDDALDLPASVWSRLVALYSIVSDENFTQVIPRIP